MQPNISVATVRNWERLNVDISSKLVARANKQLSKKIILPIEYLSCAENTNIITEIIDYIISNKINTFNAIYSLAVNLLRVNNLYNLEHIQGVLNQYTANIDDFLISTYLPNNERDILGLIYQSILFEGQKNKIGSYYTPQKVVENMVAYISFENNKLFLDPCCGSGSYLLSINANPSQIYGIDNDFVAVFICKINMLIKYKTDIFIPQIYCLDFLQIDKTPNNPIENISFDYIISNPPWGAECKNVNINIITSKESFSYFLVKSFSMLKQNGVVRFLYPKSILNVKVHKDIRHFMLNNGNIESITLYDGMFSGVTTHYVDIEFANKPKYDYINLYTSKKLICVDKKSFYTTENLIFNFHSDIDSQIIQQVKQIGRYTLKDSIWALGVVTGDNKNKLLKKPTESSEVIYTGKDITPFILKKPTNFIEYKRENFQQVAKEEYYRATEKLVYKFISSKLVFAYDNNRSLFLNSANILIPNIENMSIKTVMAFLNSELFQYVYLVLFSEIKILKGNLMELPFPSITKEQNLMLINYVEKILNGNETFINIIQDEIYKIFNIDEKQKIHIKEKINGAFN